MANKKHLVVITTYNRENLFWDSYNSIDQEKVDVLIVQDGSKNHPYSQRFNDLKVEKIIKETQRGIGHSKKKATAYALENKYEHIFIVEDDVKVSNNEVWDFCINFSKRTGLKHFNWNTAQPNILKKTFEISGEEVSIHQNVQGSFSYFHKTTFDHCEWDDYYKNAYEHVDIEYQLIKKRLLPPFWNFASPIKLNEYLVSDDGGISTITANNGSDNFTREIYRENLINATKHWNGKWDNIPNIKEIKDLGLERTELRLKWIQKTYGVPDKKKRGRKPKPNPVSVVACIKDRCLIQYSSAEDFLPKELAIMKQHDQIISLVHKAQFGMGGINLNQHLVNNKEGFRPFDHFLKTLNKQSHEFKGDVELVIVDYSSKDDDVQDLLDLYWDHEVKYVQIPYEEKFSRGFALHKGIQEAKYERLHISDVDMTYWTPNPLIEASELEVGERAIFPQIVKEHSPSSLFMYVETAGFGIASYTKTDYNKTKGYINKFSWGLEDERLWSSFVDLLGKDKIKRTLYRDCIHQFHSDSHRDKPPI